MKPILHTCIDFETAALGERAAILSVAAVPFLLPSDNPNNMANGGKLSDADIELSVRYEEIAENIAQLDPFHKFINATSCVMEGMDFDTDTIKFWANQSDEAKLPFATADYNNEYVSVRTAFESLVKWLEGIKADLNCDLRLWAQGTDFDIPKLRYCCTTLLSLSEKNLPWKYYQVCDARSYVLENLALLFGRKEGNKAIYADIPKPEGAEWPAHTALGDAHRTAYNVQQVNRMLMERCLKQG